MDSLVTQGLMGLVFVLSVALWSKSSSPSSSSGSTAPGSASAAKKNKKKKKPAGTAHSPAPEASVPQQASSAVEPVLAPEAIPVAAANGHSDSHSPAKANGKSGGGKKKGGDKKMTLENFTAKTNEERVEQLERERRGDAGEKDVGRDMIDRELQPENAYKKVARIEPAVAPKVYASTAPDDGWENVGGKAKAATVVGKKTAEAPRSNAWASSNPFAMLPGSGAEVVKPNGKAGGPSIVTTTSTTKTTTTRGAGSGAVSGGENGAAAQTKRQRQNAARAQAKKAEKEAVEAGRLATLAQHKKQVEAERMREFYKKQPNASNPPASSQWSGQSLPPSSKGGATARATINEKGSLVWD